MLHSGRWLSCQATGLRLGSSFRSLVLGRFSVIRVPEIKVSASKSRIPKPWNSSVFVPCGIVTSVLVVGVVGAYIASSKLSCAHIHEQADDSVHVSRFTFLSTCPAYRPWKYIIVCERERGGIRQ